MSEADINRSVARDAASMLTHEVVARIVGYDFLGSYRDGERMVLRFGTGDRCMASVSLQAADGSPLVPFVGLQAAGVEAKPAEHGWRFDVLFVSPTDLKTLTLSPGPRTPDGRCDMVIADAGGQLRVGCDDAPYWWYVSNRPAEVPRA